ncbi:vWA domain-containing protein [Pseudaestuariivita sp.]|uniref:vWA domain-containing protein n=1 Tax=Pseudaestuariivita sp. TaxID=2211669 RepID=UPI004059C358
MTGTDRSARARAHLAERDPALGLLMLWCVHQEHGGDTQTDGDTIRYGPAFDTLPLQDQVGTVAHHVLHVALRHTARAGAMKTRLGKACDTDLYALITDAIVNETLRAGDLPVPPPSVTLTGLLKESGLNPGTPRETLAKWEAEKLYFALLSDPAKAASARKYADGKGFKQDIVPSENGDVAPDEETAWRAHLARAEAAGQGVGHGIGPLLARLAALAPAKLPWERELRHLFLKATLPKPQVRWSRPSRRWIARAGAGDLTPFEPARRGQSTVPRIVVAIDTSSSVTSQQWDLFAAELSGIQRRSGALCTLLAFDDDVHHEATMEGAFALDHLQVRRGGGTSFVPVFDRAAELDPSLLILLSDGDAPLPKRPPFDVVWVLPPGTETVPDFGRILMMD